jgi:hypothetical protein
MCAPGPTPSLFSFRIILRGIDIEEMEEGKDEIITFSDT